jgi:membrane protease YdiL (CAAX protease family)
MSINACSIPATSQQVLFPGPQSAPGKDKVPDVAANPTGLCTRLAYGIANCVKRFGFGVAAAGIIAPVQTSVSHVAQVVGLVPSITRESTIRGTITKLKNIGFVKFDIEKLLNAPCFFKEYVRQYNSHFPSWPRIHQTVLSTKVISAVATVTTSLSEEIILRGLVQDGLLTRIPKYVIQKIAPGKETALDSSIAKVARILLVSAAFSSLHLLNPFAFDDSFVHVQVVATFTLGIGLSILKESKAGLLGAMGARLAYDVITHAPSLWSC